MREPEFTVAGKTWNPDALISWLCTVVRKTGYFIDNVITTGITIGACRRALGWGTGLIYADASSRENLPLA